VSGTAYFAAEVVRVAGGEAGDHTSHGNWARTGPGGDVLIGMGIGSAVGRLVRCGDSSVKQDLRLGLGSCVVRP